MKLVNPSFLLALGTTLALVEAVPLRLLVVTNNPELAQGLRFGNAVQNVNADDGPAFPPPPFLAGPEGARIETRPPCIMRKMRDKAIEVSNAFRTALGLPLIEAPSLDLPKEHHDNPMFRILPFIGAPPTFVKVEGEETNGALTGVTKGGEVVRIVGPDHDGNQPPHPPHHPHKHHKHGKHHKHHRCRKAPFFKRLALALMTLGPWEGRAVAFVLGCGLGVLLRMMWVLSVITFRAIRGRKAEETEYTIIHEYIEDDEAPTSAPPSYAYVDEKVDTKKNTEESPVA